MRVMNLLKSVNSGMLDIVVQCMIAVVMLSELSGKTVKFPIKPVSYLSSHLKHVVALPWVTL